jgi:hypothetical protein
MKYYDANADGEKGTDEAGIGGWPISYSGTSSGSLLTTEGSGNYSIPLDTGDYTISETVASSPWVQTGPSPTRTYPVSIASCTSVSNIDFGNVCTGARGQDGTIGFWSNSNGKALYDSDDNAALVSLNLRKASGGDFDPADYPSFRTWLKGATATNMAHMLSAQLAAAKLNVLNGRKDGTWLIKATGTTSANPNGFATLDAVIAEADAALLADGSTPNGDPNRAYQQFLMKALEGANNNTGLVQPDADACPDPFFTPGPDLP